MFVRGEGRKKKARAGSEKEKLYGILSKIIDTLSINKVLWTGLFFLASGIILDTVSCIKLCYNEGNLIAVIVLIWTFTVSFSVYCIEHFGESYYGIPRADILLSDLGLKGLSALAGLVFMEIIALIIAIIFNMYFTIVIVAFEQIFVTIYIPMIVIIKTSYTNTLEQIEQEAEHIIRYDLSGLYHKLRGDTTNISDLQSSRPRLFQMIRELDYTNDTSRGRLLNILKKVSDLLQEELEQRPFAYPDYGPQKRKEINTVSCQIALDVLNAVHDREIRIDFFSHLAEYSASLEFSQGIMTALLTDPTPDNISVCRQLLLTETKYQRQLQIWCAVYNVYMQTFAGEEWRSLLYTKQMFRELYTDWGKDDMKAALEAWEQMQDSHMNYEPLFQYIFPVDGKELL